MNYWTIDISAKNPSEIGVTKQLSYEKLINLIENNPPGEIVKSQRCLESRCWQSTSLRFESPLLRWFSHLFPMTLVAKCPFRWSEKSSLFRVKLPISKYFNHGFSMFSSSKNTNCLHDSMTGVTNRNRSINRTSEDQCVTISLYLATSRCNISWHASISATS